VVSNAASAESSSLAGGPGDANTLSGVEPWGEATGPKSVARAAGRANVRVWVELAKPGITRLVLMTTALGALLARGHLSTFQWGCTLVGTALVVAAANALNQVAEIEIDALMERTRGRPLPTGRLTAGQARIGAFIAAAFGLGMLLAVEVTCALLALVALVVYVWLYTPLKRRTPHALYVGAVPGAMPPLIGYAAASRGVLDELGWVLFGILAIWQIPHFLAIAVFRREEYARAGLKVFSVTSAPRTVRWMIVGWSVVLLLVSLIPAYSGMASTLYLSLSVAFGLAFVFGAVLGLRRDSGYDWARSLFFASMPYLMVLFLGLLL
jgi:heme o synthase